LTEKRSEDLIGNKRDGRKGETPFSGPDMARVNDRPDILRVNDRPDILRVNDGPDVRESEKRSDSKKKMNARCDPNNLQAERGGLKVKDSDFKTK
jgi:hypothetical protein